jgi:hypothetical protein
VGRVLGRPGLVGSDFAFPGARAGVEVRLVVVIVGLFDFRLRWCRQLMLTMRGVSTGSTVGHVGAVDDAVIARGKVIALARGAVALVGGCVVDGHIIILKHLQNL